MPAEHADAVAFGVAVAFVRAKVVSLTTPVVLRRCLQMGRAQRTVVWTRGAHRRRVPEACRRVNVVSHKTIIENWTRSARSAWTNEDRDWSLDKLSVFWVA